MPPSAERASSFTSLWRRVLGAAVALTVAATAAGCAADTASDDAEQGASQDAILGGQSEPNYPGVGMLQFKSGSFGTGALISPTLVLTAAHVALGHPTQFFYGTPAAGKTPTSENLSWVPVAEIIVHPCYQTPKAAGCPGTDKIDVALVRLAKPIYEVKPLKLVEGSLMSYWSPFAPFSLTPAGTTCAAVGFGAYIAPDGKTSLGSRRSATSIIDSIGPTEIVTTRGTGIATGGDSGGPLICGDLIVGTVRGSAAATPKGSNEYLRIKEGYQRTDLWRAWINSNGYFSLVGP